MYNLGTSHTSACNTMPPRDISSAKVAIKHTVCGVYILSVYSPFSDRVGLPLHDTPFPGVLMKSIGAAFFDRMPFLMSTTWLQTTQPTSGGAVTADKNCCANCVEPSRPQQWGPDLPFFGHAGHADPLDGWRCCSQKRVMSRPIQVRQH